MSNEYQESYHFIVSHPEAVAKEMTRYCATITRLTAEIENLRAALGNADACIVCGQREQARKVIRAALGGE